MTPTVSMRPNVSDRFRETLFVDRFHVSRPIGKRETETVAYWRGRASSLPPTPCLAERSQDALLRLPAGPEWLMVGRLPLRPGEGVPGVLPMTSRSSIRRTPSAERKMAIEGPGRGCNRGFAFRAIAKARASPMMICRHQGNG